MGLTLEFTRKHAITPFCAWWWLMMVDDGWWFVLLQFCWLTVCLKSPNAVRRLGMKGRRQLATCQLKTESPPQKKLVKTPVARHGKTLIKILWSIRLITVKNTMRKISRLLTTCMGDFTEVWLRLWLASRALRRLWSCQKTGAGTSVPK